MKQDLEAVLEAVPQKARTIALTFFNRGDAPAFVDKRKGGLVGWILRGLFLVEPEAPFVGPTPKFPAPKRGDFVELAPGASVRAELKLDAAFGFEPGQTYTVRFEAMLGNPDDADLVKVTSNAVSL